MCISQVNAGPIERSLEQVISEGDSMSRAKRNSVLLLLTAMLLVLILAMGLPGLVLAPGQSFSLGQAQPQAASGSVSPLLGAEVLILILRGLLAVSLILLPLYIVLSLLTREGRRRLIANVVLFGIILLAADYVGRLRRNLQPIQSSPIGEIPDLGALGRSEPTIFFSATPPPWLTFGITLAVSILTVALLVAVFLFIRERRRPYKTSFERLTDEAQKAIELLRAGSDLGETIIVCYREMSRVIRAERGIEREAAMTPREFERHLQDKGFPQASIQTLTRLF